MLNDVDFNAMFSLPSTSGEGSPTHHQLPLPATSFTPPPAQQAPPPQPAPTGAVGYDVVFIFGALVAGQIVLVFAVRLWIARNTRRRAEEAAHRAEEAAHRAEEAAHREMQEGYRQQIARLVDQTMEQFESIPELVRYAEGYLDQAETDFSDHAFAPFWDSVEKTVYWLGRFDESVRQIGKNSSFYTGLVKQYESTPPEFPLRRHVAKLSVGSAVADRMKTIVRKGQRDFQFAVIYEQRKTNQLLVAGFTNLAQALEQMTLQVQTSIEGLSGSIDAMGSTLNESLAANASRLDKMAEAATRHREVVSKEASERAGREKKVIEMLDNIQHRRRPS